VTAGLVFARSAVAVRRVWQGKNAEEAVEKSHVRYFLTSLNPEEGRRIPMAVRGHWSVENLNHYKRDTSLWKEDDHRHRRINIAQNLALTRNALLALIPFGPDDPLSAWFEIYHRHPGKAIGLILHAAPVQ
jgi:predicted transposase YbfD/YdcC